MKLTILDLIQTALEEDMPRGDLTTDLVCDTAQMAKAKLFAKEDLVLSGSELFARTFLAVDPDVQLKWFFKDGDLILAKQTVAVLTGRHANLLKAERVALNFIGHLSGIATLTKCFVEKLHGTQTRILDTRKTTPLLRRLEKEAVVHGGGQNHRMSLSDAILIKENHIAAAGGVAPAIAKVRKKSHLAIEVEVRNLNEVQEAIKSKAERILLDNMNLETMKQALELIPSGVEVEASGNMNLDRVRAVAELGVHYISVGAITHSAPTADYSLMIEPERKS